MAENPKRAQDTSLRTNAIAGIGVLGALVIGVVGWAALSEIAGAVVAPGQIAVETAIKRVQHREGGIVADIFVREGQTVEAGQLLVRLDSVLPQANVAVLDNQAQQLSARRLRLISERDGSAVLSDLPETPSAELAAMIAAEQRLLTTRRQTRLQQKAQLSDQVDQVTNEISGLEAQLASLIDQRRLIDGELEGIRSLYARGLAPLSRLNALEREAERLDGQRGELTASVARARSRISEVRMQALQIDSEHLALVLEELKETELRLAELTEQRVAAADELRRVELRAPRAGHVHQLAHHTLGGVISPGETLMFIVPQEDDLIVEARIEPQHIDQVAAGRRANVRFTAFGAADTPEAIGEVQTLSADAVLDEATGASFYRAQLRLERSGLPQALADRLVAGMPAEVHIETSKRSALSYFLKPLTDQFARTFRED